MSNPAVMIQSDPISVEHEDASVLGSATAAPAHR
jgi:hypothetical protein